MAVLPEEFLNNMKVLLGDEYDAYLNSFQNKRVYGLRVNTAKISASDFLKISPFKLKPIPWTDNGFYYDESERPGKHPYYFAGLYYLQEPSAMVPAKVIPIEKGDKVLDICAAPGGKSTELAARLAGSGTLFANDISNSRAQALLKNLELFGVKNPVIMSENPEKMKDVFEGYFDKIVIDAPCSGEGMFRKEPAVIKSWIEHGNEFYVKLQKSITECALKMLRPGGQLLYSTCTFSPLEDEDSVLRMMEFCPELQIIDKRDFYEGFSEGRPDMAREAVEELRGCIRIFPHKVSGEGHFAALLKKGEKNGSEEFFRISKDTIPFSKLPDCVRDFMELVSMEIEGSFRIKNDKVYYLSFDEPDMKGLRVMRSGLLLGEIKKNRFEPSQAFAMALKEKEFKNTVSFGADDPRTLKYLKGETIDASDLASGLEGWTLVCVDHYPLGFAKANRGILKNKYLAGWRYQ